MKRDEVGGREREGEKGREGGRGVGRWKMLNLSTDVRSSLSFEIFKSFGLFVFSFGVSTRLSSRSNLVPRARINRRYYSSIWIKLLLCGGRLFPALHGSRTVVNRRMANRVSQIDPFHVCGFSQEFLWSKGGTRNSTKYYYYYYYYYILYISLMIGH